MTANYIFPPALKHGEIREVFDNVFFVTGTCRFKGPITIKFSRNMTILRDSDELTLINSVRLNDNGLRKLDALGTVKNLIRIAGFHGTDDPFYKNRYSARIWSVDAPYTTSFEQPPKPETVYFSPDIILDNEMTLPVKNTSLYLINSSRPAEALILLERDNGILIAGDSLQNWVKTDRYFSFLGKIMMKRMGFIKAHNIGPAWLKFAKPDVQQVKGLLDLEFSHVLPAHGEPVINNAKTHYRDAIMNL